MKVIQTKSEHFINAEVLTVKLLREALAVMDDDLIVKVSILHGKEAELVCPINQVNEVNEKFLILSIDGEQLSDFLKEKMKKHETKEKSWTTH